MISIDELEYRIENEFEWVSHGAPVLLSSKLSIVDGVEFMSVRVDIAGVHRRSGSFSTVTEILRDIELMVMS